MKKKVDYWKYYYLFLKYKNDKIKYKGILLFYGFFVIGVLGLIVFDIMFMNILIYN